MKRVLSRNSFLLFALAMFAAKLWLVNAHMLMATITPHDDLLFLSQANSILSGKWLGDYNQMTLIKGQFYPIFIAFSYYLNIPLLAAQQLLYALASLITVLAVYPLVKQRWVLFLLFVFLLFNPFSYNYPAVGRIFRLGIYASLGLLTISCFIGLYTRAKQSWKNAVIWSLGAGVFLTAFWNTREESVWIVPSLVLLISFGLFQIYRRLRPQAIVLAGLYFLPVVLLLGGNQFLKYTNYSYYGVSSEIELKTPEFKSAYGGLLRIKSEHWKQFFPVVEEVRESAYEVSSAFYELKPFLEGPVREKWQSLAGVDDIPAAFFIWAFRDSLAYAGYYKNGPRTLRFYERMGREINDACTTGKLDCRPRITSLIPTWHSEFNKLLLPTYYSVIKTIIGFRNFSASTLNKKSHVNRKSLLMYEVVTREKLLPGHQAKIDAYPAYHKRLDREKIRLLNDIGSVYKVLIGPLFILSFFVFIFSTVKGILKRNIAFLTIVSGAALAGILSIAFILTLLTITSYSEIGRAMHSAYPMVLLFIVAASLDVLTRISQRSHNVN